MTIGLLASAIIDGLAYAMVIYLIATGLVIIFGLMDILNFAHASFFMLSLYLTITIMGFLNQNFILTVIVVTLVGFVAGVVTEITLMRPLYGKPTAQMLVTMGLMLIIVQIAVALWPMGLTFPARTGVFRATAEFLGYRIYVYKLIIFAVGVAVFGALEVLLSKTRFGAQIRAGTENRVLAEIYGINVKKIFTLAFGVGTALAFFGGAIASPWLNASVEVGTSFTLLSFAVIVVGGMKSHRGAFIASFLMGLIHQLTAYFVTELSFVVDILLMIIVLLVKPEGLFGGESE